MMSGKTYVVILLLSGSLLPVQGASVFQRGSAVSEGGTPFGVTLFDIVSSDPATGGGDLYFNSLDWEPNTLSLLGISWDELYRIDPVTGDTTRLGPILLFNAAREEVLDPPDNVPYGLFDTQGVTSITYRVDITVTFFDCFDNHLTVRHEATFSAEHTFEPTEYSPSVLLISDSVDYMPTSGDLQRAHLFVTLDCDDEQTSISFYNAVTDPDYTAISGVIRVMAERNELAEPKVSMPMPGFSVSPQGEIMGLSDEWHDVSGTSRLYRLVPVPGEPVEGEPGEVIQGSQYVKAIPMVQLDTPGIDTLEWVRGSGEVYTLHGTGNSRQYVINPETGACTDVGAIGQDVVDLDSTLDGLLNGLTQGDTEPPAIIGVNHSANTPVPYTGDSDLWGYSSIYYTNADLDQDWDVDLDDFVLFSGCLGGPSIPPAAGCDAADIDMDGDVDLRDFSIFQAAFNR